MSQNSRQHGFYSDALNAEEREAYESQGKEDVVDLSHEIKALRAKIRVYLRKWLKKQEKDGEDSTKVAYRVLTEDEEGERVSEVAGFYHAGSIEDRPLMRALNELRKLVDAQARFNPDASEDLLAQINAELRAASHGQVTLSWANRRPQERLSNDE